MSKNIKESKDSLSRKIYMWLHNREIQENDVLSSKNNPWL